MLKHSGNIIYYFINSRALKSPLVPEADTECAQNIKAGCVAGMRWEFAHKFSVPLVLAASTNSAGTNTCKKKRKPPSPPVID
jgi:hypothetical protein